MNHPFEARPHRTLLTLSVPVMLSLIAEPVAGVVDTAFVERLGASYAAALGAATALLSGVLWIFNFLGVGTQTEVAHALGQGRRAEAREASSLALALAVALGAGAGGLAWGGLDAASAWMSDDPAIRSATETYAGIRLLGMPAGIGLMVAFGALRGLQDMRTPMWIAGGMSALNVALDPLLIFGWGPVPALGIAGAAWATVASQTGAAAVAVVIVVRRLGWTHRMDLARTRAFFVVGRDFVIRTAALLLFLILATRVAVQMGASAGAAHQAMRQTWMLLAFLLDAYAATAQTLVGYFLGAGRVEVARRVAFVSVGWGLATGVLIGVGLWLAEPLVAALLVPAESRDLFAASWPVVAFAQPLNAVSFVTDGIHWGTRDYAYLRNAVLLSSAVGIAILVSLDTSRPEALAGVWATTTLWIALRAGLGWLRIWPGIGDTRLGAAPRRESPLPLS